MPTIKPAGYNQYLKNNPNVTGIDLLIADLNGVLRGKRVQPSALQKVFKDGICLPASVFALDITGVTVEETGLGVSQGDSDRICHPIPGTLANIPWHQKEMGQLLMTMYEADHQPFFADPRQVLHGICTKFKELRLTPVVAVELEFYLLDKRRDKQKNPQPPISPATGKREHNTQVYAMNDLDDYGEFLETVSKGAYIQGIPADTALAEYAPGQFEINLKHKPDPLTACDNAILLKRLIKGVSWNLGLQTTFMAKPYAKQAGSGMHIHVSLLNKEKKNIFMDPKSGTGSTTLHYAIGGMADTMAESMAIFCPNANSYRRFQPDLYVPMAPTWGLDNRTVALRIPTSPESDKRIEHRVSGADANPYLVVAAILAGIYNGIENKINPPEITMGDAIAKHPASLPMTWIESLKAFSDGKIIKELLGTDFSHVYYQTRYKEMQEFDRHVTPLELDWYLRTV
ncbi:MAG: glutamine synthetase family protein [Candidatus Neomarinimicrobiota bacterium]|nr:glutamine synthetase family protein [Candidatus Neomarinimicrobiota bacterium]